MSVFSLPPTSKRLNDRQRVELDRAFQQQQLSDQEQQKLLRDNKEQHALHDRHVVQTQQQRDAPPLPLGGNGLSLLDLIDTDNAECAENAAGGGSRGAATAAGAALFLPGLAEAVRSLGGSDASEQSRRLSSEAAKQQCSDCLESR